MALRDLGSRLLGSQTIEYIVERWHTHRIPILLATFGLLLLLRVCLHLTNSQPENLALRRLYGNTVETAQQKLPLNDKAAHSPGRISIKPEKATGIRRVRGGLPKPTRSSSSKLEIADVQVLIFYSSIGGSTKVVASRCAEQVSTFCQVRIPGFSRTVLEPKVLDLAEVEYEDYFVSPPGEQPGKPPIEYLYLMLIPSYDIDTINDTFLESLKETHNDFRIDTAPLSPLLGYSVFGLGDRESWPSEDQGFCFQAKEVDKWLAKLTGRKRAYPMGVGDLRDEGFKQLREWTTGVLDALQARIVDGHLGEGVSGSGDAVESDDDAGEGSEDGEEEVMDSLNALKRQSAKEKATGELGDVEDLGSIMEETAPTSRAKRSTGPIAIDFTSSGAKADNESGLIPVKEMVPKTSPTYAALTKQGYSIVGSHSGVKICRWTKSALRGRGSCYKYSFYGIASHRCMEATPSLSCSNKCVFCWRHGTNPVGTTWRWVVDPPQLIFDGMKEGHYQKIKMMRGVPGVRAERFTEAMRIRHCALSLVGEPIFYPHINEFLDLLHSDRISSFLVCNAQHPDQLAALKHVTQLYVSIDASNKDSLKKIDRPLHRDFWERFQRCLDILREKRFRQRTVFRLTLVKGFNIDDEVEGYADLVARGLPCFVEIKGVTFCGTSTSAGAGLTMGNVPFYNEVCDFVNALDAALRRRGLAYGIAAEHAHSCCVLIASERFKVDDKWHTLIDYEKFFELLEAKGADGDFSPEDYMGAETPEWATWGRGGFDPRDQRVDRKGRPRTDV